MGQEVTAFLNARRVMEWANVRDELADLLEREWKLKLGEIGKDLSGAHLPFNFQLIDAPW